MNNKQVVMPESVQMIIGRLEKAGFEAFAVGGCVRDACLGRTPNDWDITTNALPEQVKSIFARTVDTGIAHGTVTVLANGEGYEVTTYRIDGEYEDARHPKEVSFTPELKEDLRRRDFTINAMAYNDRTGIVDIYGGMEDLAQGVIRCVGNAWERFGEDALRILRAVRFSAQLGFVIEEETGKAARQLAPNLRKISAERIYTELLKTVCSDHPDWLKKAYELDITKEILPEFDAIYPDHGERTLQTMGKVPPKAGLRLTMLMHKMGTGSECEGMLRRLKSDRATMRKVHVLVDRLPEPPVAEAVWIRHMASEMGRENFEDYLICRRAWEPTQLLEKTAQLWEGIREAEDPLTIQELSISGNQLMANGIPRGKRMGDILKNLLDYVLEDPSRNCYEILMEEAKRLASMEDGDI